ncbi:23S rRNA (uracil(1939)-C(5))-methyltransferase RlmD [Scatolibacter rhodanostii]|uniref:23S rRNA (uracil(1939)-C(5))-methyltransferase RlmD n=1 Tax=Scatolibacter rhodanostii TaxID=2014781 RepID=UPI000C074560|nr:23S rRNA (uracil(1939)-C(5))-methyltransferase RlmD [Scatolibacter rhodanostii]
MNLKKNDIIPLSITGMTADGLGVGRYDNFPIFVPLSAINDSLMVRIVKVTKRFAFGRIEEILNSSSDRITSDCPYFTSCGGCTYRHISYKSELAIKQQKVTDALSRIGAFKDLPIQAILGDCRQSTDGYRNKALIPLGKDKDGKLQMGFYAVNSHRIVDALTCRLQPAEFNLAMKIFREWHRKYPCSIYDEFSHSGLLRKLYLRKGEKTGEVMVGLISTKPKIPQVDELLAALQESLPTMVSFVVNINPDKTNVALGNRNITLWGKDTIEDELCGLTFDISPLSFYQVNRNQAEILYRKAAEYAGLTGNEILLDFYCGIGTIGLSMAHQAKKVIGVEIIPDAIVNAKENAKRNRITNAEFICGDAAQAALELRSQNEIPDVIIVDPPRKGCDLSLIETIVNLSPKRVVYVSCDPATLARDLRIFAEKGYHVTEVTPVDMFPRTAHVESVVLLSKLKSTDAIEVNIDLDEIDLTKSESKATYDEIKQYVLDNAGLKVSPLYIAQVKRKYGIIERDNYNLGDSKARVPQVPLEKKKAITDALRHFRMIDN